MIDIIAMEKEAREEVAKAVMEKAKIAFKKKLLELEAAKSVVHNIEREIIDLKADIANGSFTG